MELTAEYFGWKVEAAGRQTDAPGRWKVEGGGGRKSRQINAIIITDRGNKKGNPQYRETVR